DYYCAIAHDSGPVF
nr:immunoglobulin light chain junction region [Macaca mulatta]